MKTAILYFVTALLFLGCANGQNKADNNDFATLPKPAANEAVATFGGGCFWSMQEAMSELKGVNKVISGYAGGKTKNPTYQDVSSRTTNHAEVTQIYYDPEKISYATLAEAFLFAHDPTTLNRQGPDVGTDYRSIAFYRNDAEKNTLINVIKKVNESKHYNNPVVTQVVPFSAFYPAENYHQGYYRTNSDNPYISSVSEPKVMKFRKAMKAELKPEFQK
ncbi:peptide-methionine (S)-S-oxide reductase MsrA [Mucilaginibacter phyllosphaerae]|uniref:Peptide methionine sulfoxide reductase MsrA n=1 Tax=Mucilaginibacter phyllosphaerae TaxID=1812349 RepID=A0A4Y8ABP1_9SPHI|nr:peptide-methionine (S)-S-oxide reductase MsrA [Mucilaginibacter phyllosphaerae]MBB3969259.1 peptide-methionine (S)-S-oxide reductase [Mucilaginibacter phyllosphaerae]TEW65943.1 peptide-methionine (S)-S-oxide reductase MsrA [Mucilaginibacter phyllosphaerae]